MRIAMRQESDCLDAGDNYAVSDTKSEDSDPEDDCNLELKSKSAENEYLKLHQEFFLGINLCKITHPLKTFVICVNLCKFA